MSGSDVDSDEGDKDEDVTPVPTRAAPSKPAPSPAPSAAPSKPVLGSALKSGDLPRVIPRKQKRGLLSRKLVCLIISLHLVIHTETMLYRAHGIPPSSKNLQRPRNPALTAQILPTTPVRTKAKGLLPSQRTGPSQTRLVLMPTLAQMLTLTLILMKRTRTVQNPNLNLDPLRGVSKHGLNNNLM